MTESDYASHRVPLPLWVFATLVTVAAVAVIFFLPPGDNEFVVDPPPNGDPTLGPLSDAEMIEIANLRNLGIAHLENANLDEAVSEFSRLSELAPGERLPMQNLAIALLMQLDPESGGHIDRSKEPDRYALAADRARETIDTLLTTFPSDTVPLLLLSRLHSLTEQLPQTIEELITAAGIDGDDPAVSYELYSVIHEARDASRNSIASEALARVWKAEPDNLHVFKERLLFLARERSSQDRGDAPTFEVDAEDLKVLFQAGRDLLRPFEQKIENFARVNVLELADVGAAAVDSGDWNTVVRNASIIGNVINPEVATQNDRKRVSPHHLEFIVRDFSDEFLAAHALPQPAFPAPIDVTFQQTTLPLEKSAVKVTRIADMNLDRRPDLVTLHDKAITVWTKSSETWTESFSTDIGSGLSGLCLFDVDRDAEDVRFETDGEAIMHAEADMDAVVYGESGISVLHNVLDKETGKRQFSPVSQADEFNALKNVLAVLPVDFDHDGDLDLVVSAENGISLWLNRDDSTFAENSQFSVLPPADARIQQMIAVDWDRNVSIDVVCLGHNTAGYLQNVLHGQLRWQPFAGNGESLKEATTLALLDADASFSWDLAAATGSGTQLFATANPDAGVTQFTPAKSLSEAAVTGVTTCDYDNDGFLDLVTWQDTILSVLRGGPLGQFEAAETLRTELPSDIQTVEVGDIDADGDLDSIVTCTDSVVLLANDGGNANHWIELPIRAESALEAQKRSERVNLHGIGSFVELQAGSLYQPRVVTGASTHFGLGQLDAADSVRVLWTNGVPEHVIHPQHRQALVLQQNLKGSCPYLYTWDGEKFAFYTDCLWAAPVGLQPVEGQLLPPREWEYLKVDGDALTPRDGEYVLKLTEELWEIGYFDSVRLLAIDHPADVAIYSNEKVGPPDISAFQIHTVRTPQPPVAAVDQAGRDVLSKIEERDDVWLQCWDQRIKQGLTEPHYLELNLGELDSPRQITLFLTGWIRPTDTSLNVAITQRPDLESTSPPSVSVLDADGNWVSVRPHMGFPGGKTKTIAVDLSDVFVTDDYRVRISTTMEIYWDHVFFSVDEQPTDVVTTELPLRSAGTRYRGFSQRLPHSGNGLGPESYDFSIVSQRPHWPPMEGRLTAYGDVFELVTEIDDRQVTLGAGDEMELHFAATAPALPAGWTRDFILHNVGWDKDADLNTVFGQSVDPLPFAGMAGYPDVSGKTRPAAFANQTRRQSRPAFWRQFFLADRYRISQENPATTPAAGSR